MSTWPLALVLAWALPAGLEDAPRPAAPIIGGEPTGYRGWTNVVAVLSADPMDFNTGHLCSGTLIAPHIVLTAGHCIAEGTDPAEVAVFFGDTIYGDQIATVVRYEIFPDACIEDCEPDAYDFAFVEILEDVGSVDVIPLLTDQDEWNETMVVGNPITLAGFGTIRDDSEGEPAITKEELGHKQVVTTELIGFSKSGREFIAGAKGEDTCSGDSGGPAFVQLASGEWRQVGVTSRGVRPCGTGRGYYGVPFFVLAWLRDEAEVAGMPDDCEDYACLDPRATIEEEEDGCGCTAPAGGGAWLVPLLLGLRRRVRSRSGR